MQTGSHTARSNLARWSLIAVALTAIAVVVAALVFTRPLPPRTVVMATGPEDGAYDLIGRRYREIFARHGVKLKLQTTNGSVDNVELLREPNSRASVALVQSGITNPVESPALLSLGTLFYEPFWLFTPVTQKERTTKSFEGVRVSLGIPGSGSYKLGRDLVAAVGMDLTSMNIRDLGPVEAGEAMLRGELEFVGMSLPWNTPIVLRLLRDPKIDTVNAPRADAHVALRPYLSKLTLPRGVADLANDRPSKDLTLVATKASLIVRDDLHPALQHLLLEAASEIHSGPGVFNKAGEFPAAEPIDLPLSEIARGYYRSGRPFLQRYLPFWLAALTSRLLVLSIPIIAIVYPLFRLLPALYGWSMRRRVFRLYGELKFLEAEFNEDANSGSDTLLERLDRLEERANRMRVPTGFAHLLYTLRHHIGLVRERVRNPREEGQP